MRRPPSMRHGDDHRPRRPARAVAVVDGLTEATVEWLFPYFWAAAVDPAAWRGAATPSPAEPSADDDGGDLDLDLVRIVYGVLFERSACGICGSALGPAPGVERTWGFFTGARIVAVTHCRGPRRHRHLAKVLDRAGDLRLGQLRPA